MGGPFVLPSCPNPRTNASFSRGITARGRDFMHKLGIALSLAALAALSATAGALGQSMPDQTVREIMIKATLMTFNDANLTNNYTVFDALASEPFASEFPPDKLSELFQSFRDQGIDIAAITAFRPVEDPAPLIDSNGLLQMKGYFETTPSYVAYDMSFVGEDDGSWLIIGLNVHLAPPEELGIDTGTPATGDAKDAGE